MPSQLQPGKLAIESRSKVLARTDERFFVDGIPHPENAYRMPGFLVLAF
jgi:hypothetical protein